MAARLMVSRQRVVAYLPSLGTVVRHFRGFSSQDEKSPDDHLDLFVSDVSDSNLGPLDPYDKRFPMPGQVGFPPQAIYHRKSTLPQPGDESSPIFTEPLAQERQQTMFETFMAVSKELDGQTDVAPRGPTALEKLECLIVDCPELIKKDFQDLFPERNILKGRMTVITLSQKTDNDMTGWSPAIEEERELLLENFITGATEICEALHEAGYWADFIDPSSGRPFLGPYTHATMYETDERYRNFGFEIDDLGCCKVISHHLWGTHSYVGSLFTNAPLEHPLLQKLKEAGDAEVQK